MSTLPTGTVTFLFTDLEASTRLWEQHPEAMRDALARHDEILREAVEKHAGHVVKTTGDGLHAVFSTAHDAVAAAVAAQHALTLEEWTLPTALLVRMGVHTGEADVRDGDYYGPAVNRAARIASVAHGGQIVCSRATEELVRDAHGPEIALADLGDHQLRDLARPEHIYHVVAEGLRRDFPPLRSLDAFPGNLPVRPTSFVGRESDLAKVAAAVGRSPIVTITGVGGVGKTRLALQVAAEVVPHYPDGAWFCELAAADSPSALVQVVAVTLGIPLRAGTDPVDSVLDFVRSKELLLVLDNCEHLIDAAGDLAERVIRQCPDVRVIATSREGLAVDGEQVVPLRSLDVPADAHDAEAALGSAAVSLFIERARLVKDGFSLRDADVPAVVEICRRLDGMPLAIELAAARVVAMAPAEIAALLDERFRLLTGGRRTAVERHQTLRATVDWSYSLLDDRDRAVFERLGVFAGTFGADAAAAVAVGDGVERFDVLDALTDLVGKSLVMADTDDTGTTRYMLLETLRQYARERLDDADASDDSRRRHAAYFAEWAETLAPALWSADEIECRRRLHLDLDNLRAAVGWAFDRESRDDVELGVRIAAALFNEATLARASGMPAWALRALPFVDTTTPTRRYQILVSATWDAHAQADMDRCIALAERTLDDPVPDDIDYCLSAHIALCSARSQKGDLDGAIRIAEDGLALAEARGVPAWVFGNALAVIAMSRLGNGEYEAGLRDAQRSVEFARRSSNPSTIAMATYALGWALCGHDEDAAIVALTDTIELCSSGAIDAVFAPALCQRAVLRLQQGDVESAMPDIRRGFERSVEIGDTLTIGASTLATIIAMMRSGMAQDAAVVMGAIDGGAIYVWTASLFGLLNTDDVRRELQDALDPDGYEAARGRGAAMEYDALIAFMRTAFDALGASRTPGA